MPTRAPFPFATLPAPDEDHSSGEPQQTLGILAGERKHSAWVIGATGYSYV